MKTLLTIVENTFNGSYTTSKAKKFHPDIYSFSHIKYTKQGLTIYKESYGIAEKPHNMAIFAAYIHRIIFYNKNIIHYIKIGGIAIMNKISGIAIFSLALVFIAPTTGYAQNVNPQNITQTKATANPAHPDSKTYAVRFGQFVDGVAKCDTLSNRQKSEISNEYKKFIAEYKAVNDSMSDEDIRSCSKQKVRYQKAMARIFVNNTADDVSDTAEGVGKSVSKFFKKTKKKVQGAVDGFKSN